ncbi:MAG TPA: hypothetical protein VGI71_23945 [Scandinavium sp.]|jgi:hypothetical protein
MNTAVMEAVLVIVAVIVTGLLGERKLTKCYKIWQEVMTSTVAEVQHLSLTEGWNGCAVGVISFLEDGGDPSDVVRFLKDNLAAGNERKESELP